MSLDTWSRHDDGTLHNGTMWITRIKRRPYVRAWWRLDCWHWERVPEFPDDVREGYRRVEECLGHFETLAQAKHAGEMRLRSRGGEPRGTLSDWFKVRDHLRERVESFAAQFHAGFWDNVLMREDPHQDPFDLTWAYAWAVDAEEEIRAIGNYLVGVADSMEKRLSRTALIAKLEAVEGRTPEEAALYLKKAEELRA